MNGTDDSLGNGRPPEAPYVREDDVTACAVCDDVGPWDGDDDTAVCNACRAPGGIDRLATRASLSSIRLGTLGGYPIVLDVFVSLVAPAIAMALLTEEALAMAVGTLASILLHQFGHAVAVQILGLDARGIRQAIAWSRGLETDVLDDVETTASRRDLVRVALVNLMIAVLTLVPVPGTDGLLLLRTTGVDTTPLKRWSGPVARPWTTVGVATVIVALLASTIRRARRRPEPSPAARRWNATRTYARLLRDGVIEPLHPAGSSE